MNKPAEPGSPVETTTTSMTILMFGDDEKTSAHVISNLTRPGIEVTFIADPRVLLQMIQYQTPVCVILDLDVKDDRVPKAVLQSVRKIYGKAVLVFGLTARAGGELIDFMRSNGINDVLSKTANKETIDKKIIGRILRLQNEKNKKKSPGIEIPKIVGWFFETVSPALALISTALETIDEPETKLTFYSERLLQHGPQLIKMVRSLSKSEEDPHFIQALRLYGFDNIRNLLVMFTMGDALKTTSVGWNEKTGGLTVEPKTFIQYAVKSYNMFADNGRYRHIAFTCGLFFDYLNQLNEASPTKDANIKKQIDTRCTDALNNAKKHYKQAKGITDLAYEKHILTHLMLVEAGKIMMMFFFKDYADLLAKAEKKALKPIFLNMSEFNKYGITHDLMGSLASQMLSGLEEAAHSVLFASTPFLLQGDSLEHDSCTLSTFCSS